MGTRGQGLPRRHQEEHGLEERETHVGDGVDVRRKVAEEKEVDLLQKKMDQPGNPRNAKQTKVNGHRP